MGLRLIVLLGTVTLVLCATMAAGVYGAGAPSVAIRSYGGAAVNRPQGITLGPDGAIWFTSEESHSIGRITAGGVMTSYTDASIGTPYAITAGPDGALWFLNGADSIGRITVDGVVSSYSDPVIGSPSGITAGPDGALWFTIGAKKIGRMTTDGVVSAYFDQSIRGPYGITAGPDGALWFANYLGSSIGRITVAGAVSRYTDPRIRYPVGITTGPDGALWFTDDSGSIGRITTGGVVSSYSDAERIRHPLGITAGADGALWSADRGNAIVRITVGGIISSYTDPSVRFPVGIAAGRDGALWFTNYTGDSIGQLRIVPAKAELAGPTLTLERSGTTTAVRASRRGSVARVRVLVGVDGKATVTLTVRNPRTGANLRLQPGTSLAATTLKRPAATAAAAISGAGAFAVTALLPGRQLTRGGPYQLVLTSMGSTGRSSRLRIGFRG